jgi:biopolymer transport protein ExbD
MRPRLEIIPFIDIMFFLLATFMMVSLNMIRNEGLPVRLPQTASSTAENRGSSVTVTITESGEMYLDKQLTDLEGLKQKLRALHSENPELKVFINGDNRAFFGQAVEALDEIRSLGISKVSIQTRKRTK